MRLSSDRTLQLLFVIKSLEVRGGGAERVLLNVAGGLAQRGHTVTVATFDQGGSKPFYDMPVGVELVNLGVGDSWRETKLGEFAGRVRALAALGRQLRPHVAIGFMHSAYVVLALALVGSDVKVIGSEHTVFAHYRARRRQRIALYVSTKLLSAMTAVSERMRSTFPSFVRRKMTVIPNPVADPQQEADVFGGTSKTALSVGRLDREKDHATLIAAFGRLAPNFPDWRLRIVGEGPLRADLERQVRELGLREAVELPGAVREIETEYASAQLFALPSRYESFGLVTAEAMSHGLPVVGFADCPGTNELIENGVNGVLIEGGDRGAMLAAAMAGLMQAPERRAALGAAARTAVTGLSLAEVTVHWERLLERVRKGSECDA